MKKQFLSLSLLLALGCCACSQQKEAENPRLVDTTHLVEETPSEVVEAPLTSLTRQGVDQTIALGLAKFLQQVRVKAAVADGQFVGWEILAFRDPQVWRGVGLMNGDIITRVNDQKVERETQAYQVFISLREADTLEVDYLRGGEKMKLSLPILGEKAQSSPNKN